MAINIFCCTQIIDLIEFSMQIQLSTFMRGHLWTPIDPAPVLLSGKPCSTSHVPEPRFPEDQGRASIPGHLVWEIEGL